MTEKRAYKLLKNIIENLSEYEYPEIYSHICANIEEDEEVLYNDPYVIAIQLHESDETKLLPGCVADYLIEVYKDEIKDGNADAACDLGSLYYTGRCGKQDYAKAFEYYTISAKGGCRQAQENLGYCYYYGRSIEKDYEKAFHYFALGAFDGHICSLYKIGDMYRNGYYVEKNEKEAFRIYLRCKDTMSEEAIPFVGADVMMRLGDCYFEGIGIESDYKCALSYYQSAEQMFIDRLEDGDYMIKGCYDKVIRRQNEIREILKEKLPQFAWTK